ncbi:HAD-IA family hydrolase [Candidatus Roizmanbacteria bacterium]|nr:HAD-IA family hydrolase [Candidatus Roizmanbacteria bacterium]
MNKIKFIYFDIGGVMNDWSDYFKSAAKKHGITVEDINSVWGEMDDDITRGKKGPKDYWQRVVKKFNLIDADDFDFLESWISDYRPRLEIHELARKVSKKYEIGLISNLYNGMFPRLLELGIVADLDYSVVILSNEIGLNKKDKEIFKIATKKAGVKPSEILLIDDRKDFLENAKSLGWHTFWLDGKDVKGSVKKLEKLLL